MMQLLVRSSKDEISVHAKYNAENEKECNEVSDKIQQCISWWNCSNAIWAHSAGNGTDKRGITINEDGISFSGHDIGIKQEKSDTDPLTDYERSQATLYDFIMNGFEDDLDNAQITDYERSQATLYELLRTTLYGTKNESST